MRRRLATVVLFLCLAAWVWAREVPVTILHTTDLHGNILPVTDYDGHTNVGGLARCATVIRQVRAAEKNVLVVDAGDSIQGTAVSYQSDGLVMVRALNALRYDAWVLGNHEFDWGLGKLTGCVARAGVPVVAANLSGVPGVRPFVVREVEGVKVGIVGLTTPGIPNWSRPRLIPGVKLADSVATLREVLPAVRRAGAQVIVLVCHQGYKEGGDDAANQIVALARNFPEVDVIIGAHTHRDFPSLMISGVLYTQAAYHGIRLGRVDLVFDTDKERVTRRVAQTLPMDEGVAVDAEVTGLFREELARAEKYLATVIGEATGDFGVKGAPRRETPVHALVCEAIAGALRGRGVTVDAVLHGVLNSEIGLAKGPVTVGDVWRLVPYENTIGVAQLTRAELTEILDENAGVYAKNEFRGLWGMRWRFDPKAAEGARVLEIRRADGTALGAEERVAVAFNSYDLAGGGRRWPKLRAIVDRPECQLVEYEFTTRQALLDYIGRYGRIAPR